MNRFDRMADQERLSEIFHQLSQPLSVLECGLELSLLHDRTAAQFRSREKLLLEAANEMHRRLVELREELAGHPVRESTCNVLPNRKYQAVASGSS